MPRKNFDTLKAADLCLTRSKAILEEWVPREYSRGERDVPIKVSDIESQQPKRRKKAGRQARAENDATFQGESTPQNMDIDETPFQWVDEQVIPDSQKTVRQPA